MLQSKNNSGNYSGNMRIADSWKDYELLDCASGMKKERWGDIVLLRPDPQAIWNFNRECTVADTHGVYRRSANGGGHWEFRKNVPEYWTVSYKQWNFYISPTDFKHTGLFPEQSVNWDWMHSCISKQKKHSPKILNLFGYSGAASIVCASAGGHVTHVDAAKGMVQWCKENAELNSIPQHSMRYIVDDCKKFVERELRRGNHYDAIVMDPPSYGRGIQGEMWKFEKHFPELADLCSKLLSDTPLFFLVNSYTTGISAMVLQNVLKTILPSGNFAYGEIGLPVSATDYVLPCGIFSSWTPSL